MADTPSDKDLYDEAAMQDAIAAKKASGGLVEVNPQDAPKPVKDTIDYTPAHRHANPGQPQKTAEDKAFEELAERQKAAARPSVGKFTGQENARRAAPKIGEDICR